MSDKPMATLGDVLMSKGKDVDILQEDVALFKNLILERKHPLDLIRELLSNAGASEVGAKKIEITYTVDRQGHIFEVTDDGCGMVFTGNKAAPGRLDRFLGLGLSGIVGHKSDEFSWKGLGSKLCFQSHRVEVETRSQKHPLYHVVINEPWETLQRNQLPKPRVNEHDDDEGFGGTRIKVCGHPPFGTEQAFSFEDISTFLQHRTFAGFTRARVPHPEIFLSVLGRTELLPFGFPEFSSHAFSDGLELDREKRTLWVNLTPKSAKQLRLTLKGFLTWSGAGFGLSMDRMNVGLILSARGIPYFDLDLEEYGASGIAHANPGRKLTCLVVECDEIHSSMNISRSGLVDCPETKQFKRVLTDLFQALEGAPEYLSFRQIPKQEKVETSADALEETKRAIESNEQKWVVLDRGGDARLLMREPKNEQEVNALLWKLEALGALPFARFQTLAYPGASRGPDLLVNFQEDKASEPLRATVVEVENNFYNYRSHGHHTPQYPKVICWDAPASGRKTRLNPTQKKFKFTVTLEEHQVHVFVIRLMEGIRLMVRKELEDKGIPF